MIWVISGIADQLSCPRGLCRLKMYGHDLLSPSYRNRVRKPSCGNQNQDVQHLPPADCQTAVDVSPGQHAAWPRLSCADGSKDPRVCDGALIETASGSHRLLAAASQVWTDGGIAELHVWPGGFHGFDLMAPQARISREAIEARTNRVARLFAA